MDHLLSIKISSNVMISLVSVLVLLIIKFVFSKVIESSTKLNREMKNIWKINIETFLYFVFFIFLFFLWVNQIKFMAISLMAFAVAFVLAGKELIMCLTGYIYKTLNNDSIKVGDRIEINGLRGHILNRGIFSTTLLEIGPGNDTHQYTGRSIIIPNSYFLIHRTINESFLKDYVLHTFSIPINIKSNILAAEKILTKISLEKSAPYLEQATSYINNLQAKRNIDTPDPEPRIHLRFLSSQELAFLVRVSVPLVEKGYVEQEINREFIRRREEWII